MLAVALAATAAVVPIAEAIFSVIVLAASSLAKRLFRGVISGSGASGQERSK
jgi:hypothetical protein